MAHVLAIKSSQPLAVGAGPAKLSAAQLAEAVPAERWVGPAPARAPKDDAWTTGPASSCPTGRRRMAAMAAGPAQPPRRRAGLLRRLRPGRHLVARLGRGGRDQVGDRGRLPAGQDRGRPGSLRGPPLAGLVPAHHPGVVGPRLPGRHPDHGHHRRAGKGGRGRLTSQLGLLPLTVPEVRRLLVALVWTAPVQPSLVLAWSRWRRRHQARARRAHYQRRQQQVRLEY